MALTSYDLVEYPNYTLPQTHPHKTAVVAKMFGLDPPAVERARVLDVGCGAGSNLMPLALLFPEAQFVGIDLAATTIAKARSRAERLQLSNVRFEALDLMDLPADFGPFDYIIAHGFISWVPDAVRLRLFEVCKQFLVPNGVAYISYNAYPGAHVRDLFREIMRFHARGHTDLLERAERGREIMEVLAESEAGEDAIQELIRFERDVICRKSSGSLLADEFNDNFHSLSVQDFSDLSNRFGLQFLYEAVYNEAQPPPRLSDAAAALLNEVRPQGEVVYQQYLDFIKLRRFRQTLVVRAEAAIDRSDPFRAMGEFYYGAPLQRKTMDQGIEYTNTAESTSIVTAHPGLIHALDRIAAAWPSTVAFGDLLGSNESPEPLAQALGTLFSRGLIDAQVTPRVCKRTISEKPEIWRYARLQAEEQQSLTGLTLKDIRMEDEHVRNLVKHADGSRTIEELAAVLGSDTAGVERALRSAAFMGFLVA